MITLAFRNQIPFRVDVSPGGIPRAKFHPLHIFHISPLYPQYIIHYTIGLICPSIPFSRYSLFYIQYIYNVIDLYIYIYIYTCIFIWYSYLISIIMVMFYTTFLSVNPHLYSHVNVYIGVVFTHHECRSFYPWEKSAFHIFLFVYPTITILESSMYGIFRPIFTNIWPKNHQNVGK